MCGIAGFIDKSLPDPRLVADRMTHALSHRGPDDSGLWIDYETGVALGHRRLSIIDVSSSGHQPMTSSSGRYVVVFNGEIYNHTTIRQELEAYGRLVMWRGRSDTETLLAAIEQWNIEGALRRAIGMFAFGVWDRALRRLTLARDRVGEKPLYYASFGKAFLFASELKGIRTHPASQREVDRDALAQFLRYSYVPDPGCIYRNIRKLPAGSVLEVDESGSHGEPTRYWSASQAIANSRSRAFVGDDSEALDAFEKTLGDAIDLQMIADVPLGAFLSGGIDSSLVVAMMQSRTSRPVKTFTIGFAEKSYDESSYARAIAKHLQTDHTELVVTPAEAMRVIPELPRLYDEPFADSSQIPTYLVSSLARRNVTVSLSGDAGDELFGGYTRYDVAERVWALLGKIPGGVKRFLPALVKSRSTQWWDGAFKLARPIVPPRLRYANMGTKLYRLIGLLEGSSAKFYHSLISHWSNTEELVLGSCNAANPVELATGLASSYREQMMYWDLITYLPGDILVKVDRAAMAVGLETRVPMLDHRMVEFAWSLPLRLKVRNGQGKWIMRELLRRFVPQELTDRPKMGFGIPLNQWLRGPLRDWAEALLSESRIRREGYLNPAPIRKRWDEHLAETHDWSYLLWDVLMFQAWIEQGSQSGLMPSGSRSATVVGGPLVN